MAANESYAHLVGSVPLSDSETVFRTVCEALGAPPAADSRRRDGRTAPVDLVPAGHALEPP